MLDNCHYSKTVFALRLANKEQEDIFMLQGQQRLSLVEAQYWSGPTILAMPRATQYQSPDTNQEVPSQ